MPNVFPHKHADPAGVMPGFDYDVTNETIFLQLKVEDGKIIVPGGIKYRVLVLPEHKVLSMAVLEKTEELVTFNELLVWMQHSDERIKYYSGTAVYNKAFNIDFELEKVKQYFLTLGSVKDVGIAEVKMNEKNVWPFLTGEQKAAKDRFLYWKTRQAFAMRGGNWKLLVHRNSNKAELYNLENDFREKSDISESNPEKVKYLWELLEKIKCSIQTCSVMT